MTQQASTIGRYLIQQRLGQGGMGALYLARDPHIDRLVALKLLHAHLADHDVRRRFAQEARAAGALAHPNIVTIHDYGEWDGVPYIVMEYVRGETLAEVISRRLPASTDSRLRWIEEMCAGLSLAHAAGVVHRDIKPANLMIDQNGTLKILDFGIARVSDASATNTTSIVGTPSYMSPEQVRGEGIDHRSDIFSAGAVLYELLSFQKAFPGPTPHTILHRVLHVDPVPLAELCTGLDARVETIVRRALEKDVSRRYPGIAEMRSALARLRAELPNPYDAPTVVAPLQPQQPPASGRSLPTPSSPVSVGAPSSRLAQRAPETPGPRPDDTVDTRGTKDDATWIVAGTAHRREAAEACRRAAAAMDRGANLVARQLLDEVLALDPLNPDARRLLDTLTERQPGSRGTALPIGASSGKGARDVDRAGGGGSRVPRHATAAWLVTGVAGVLALVGLLAWVATTSNADPESPHISSVEPIGTVAPALPAAPPAVVAVQPDPATAVPPADEPQRVAPKPVAPAAARVPPSQTTGDNGASPATTRRAPDQPRPATPTNGELERRRTEQTILESLQRAQAADLIARLDASGVQRDLERAEQALRQAVLDLRIAEGESREAQAVASQAGQAGETLDVEEARIAATLAERRLERARREFDDLEPLLAPGHITRDELERADIEREQAEAAARLAARRLDTLRRLIQPREKQRALVQLSQSDARVEHARQRVDDAGRQVEVLREALDACAIFARGGGLVVYEDHVGATPRRRVRVGDRVTPSQGLVTIPEVTRMLVHTSIREADVHRVQAGAPARIRVDAFPALELAGRVLSVGTLARTSLERPSEDKRFDLVVDLASAPEQLRPEMTARVEIRVSERDDVLLVPINAVFETETGPTVHVVTARGVDSRRVTLGQVNEFHYEVVAGLEAGERVRLTDEAATALPPQAPLTALSRGGIS